jgi:hypothetical protein
VILIHINLDGQITKIRISATTIILQCKGGFSMKHFIAFLILFTFPLNFLSAETSQTAKKLQPCIFNGTVDGVQVKSFEGDILHNAGPSYLTLSLKINDVYWMMDLTGVTKKPGKTKLLLILKKHDGKKFSESYSAEAEQQIFQNPKVPVQFGIFKSTFTLKDKKGKTILVNGDFVWDTSRFPR